MAPQKEEHLLLPVPSSGGSKAPHYGPTFSQFHAVFRKVWQNHMLPHFSGGLDPLDKRINIWHFCTSIKIHSLLSIRNKCHHHFGHFYSCSHLFLNQKILLKSLTLINALISKKNCTLHIGGSKGAPRDVPPVQFLSVFGKNLANH